MTLLHLQQYWWLLIAVLAAFLVFFLFVQGGQTMFLRTRDNVARTMMVNSIGRKWELTFTTLVVFGGAFFASFPLFYSTSFGGAYWLWILILLSFIIQAFSYEFRRKPGNIFGTGFYDTLLLVNGCAGCVLLGVAVGTMFFGGDFTIEKGNLLNGADPVISQWGSGHGLEAICSWRNLLLGFTILFLARMQAAFYFMNNFADAPALISRCRREMMINGGIFVVLFLILTATILSASGLRYSVENPGLFVPEDYIYLHNFLDMWWVAAMFLIGVVLVLYALVATILNPANNARGIWFSGTGTILVIIALFCVLGYNGTAYYQSLTSPQSSLSIQNSSSTEFTLRTMAWVSLFIPVVIAYIAYVWRKMDATPITPAEVEDKNAHLY